MLEILIWGVEMNIQQAIERISAEIAELKTQSVFINSFSDDEVIQFKFDLRIEALEMGYNALQVLTESSFEKSGNKYYMQNFLTANYMKELGLEDRL